MNQLQKTKEEFKNHFNKMSHSHILKKVIYGVGILIILSVVFHAGEFVGFHKAKFGRDWGDHYEKNFGPRPHGPMGGIPEGFPNGHGTIGKIEKIELPNIIVIDKDNIEKVIVINDMTDVINMRQKASSTDLKDGDRIVVIGSPNDQGQIVAKFVRILPADFESPITNPKQ